MSFTISETTVEIPANSNGVGSSQTDSRHMKTFKKHSSIIDAFLYNYEQLKAHKHGHATELDGHTLAIADVIAIARFGGSVRLNTSKEVKGRVEQSRAVIDNMLRSHISIYGVSTGFGGSADTRTKAHDRLGTALLQHQNSGIISTKTSGALPLGDPFSSTTMPEAWVRAAMLIRANSLIRGHSAVRWEVLEQLADFLQHGITPVIPLRGSISASGDLSPLSYVALALSGNSAIKVFSGPSTSRRITTAPDAIKKSGLRPTTLAPKEHLGLLNGTAFSAAVASLALSDVVQLAVLAQVCTAMGTEALLGTRASYAPFIHEVTRPHPGQIEVAKVITGVLDGSRLASAAHEEEMTVEQDKGQLRQDRYALRTAPQFIGPQIEDILHAMQVVTQECNSTTDNPLIDGKARHVYHGGNFQAMAVTNAMEKTRLAVHHLGKILFAQSTELLNPAFNRGLPPSVAATDPSLNYHAKGIDIATAAYLSELGHLANPVSTHIQSAEMHNQSINSLALISARATVAAADVLTMLTASYLYVLCQALDLRAMQLEFKAGIKELMTELFSKHLSTSNPRNLDSHLPTVLESVYQSLDKTVTMDAAPRMEAVASAIVVPLTDTLKGTSQENSIKCIQAIREEFSLKAYDLLQRLRRDYLDGRRGPTPASQYMGKTKSMYEFIRVQLGVSMHGSENLNGFEGGLHSTQMSIGQNITKIYEAIRDGDMQGVLADLVASPRENGFAFSKL